MLRLKITVGQTAASTKIEDMDSGKILPARKVSWGMDMTTREGARGLNMVSCEVVLVEFETQGEFTLVHERTYRLGEQEG